MRTEINPLDSRMATNEYALEQLLARLPLPVPNPTPTLLNRMTVDQKYRNVFGMFKRANKNLNMEHILTAMASTSKFDEFSSSKTETSILLFKYFVRELQCSFL
jgi:hypothetical protein